MTRIYVSGPMTGLPDLNFPAFHAEAARLRNLGYEVVSPAEINAGLEGEGWTACMKRDIAALVRCDVIHFLPGWQSSRGANVERFIAIALGLKLEGAAREWSVRAVLKRFAVEAAASACTIVGMFVGSTTVAGALAYAVGLYFWLRFTFLRRAWGLMPLNVCSAIVIASNIWRAWP